MDRMLYRFGAIYPFSQLELFYMVTFDVSNCLEKFVCALYNYKNENTVTTM